MTRKLRAALHFSGLTALALATASCGGEPPNPQSRTDSGNFSLFDPMGQWPSATPAFSEADYFGDALPPLPQATPMERVAARDGGNYRYAPSYDYPDDEPVYYDSEPNDNSYAWLALASSLGGVFDDAPPDYYFDYDGVEPWVWETGDDFVRYAEPLDDGYRYYYYAPGRSYPFLVRDPYYSYGYYDDRVVVIYDRDGRVLDGRRSWRQRQAADRYYARAHALNEASRLRPRQGIAAPLWAERGPIIAGEQRQWDQARTQRAGWRNWDRRNEQVTAPRWTGERAARQYAARRFDSWRNQDYRGPAPRFYDEAQRSPRLRQVVAEQREQMAPGRAQRREALVQRREQMRTSAPGDIGQRGAGWQARQSAERGQGWARNASRNEARSDRQRVRQERLAAQQVQGSSWTARRGPNETRPAQADRRAFVRQREAEQQRAVSGNQGRAETLRARREARAQQQSQFRASQGQEQRQAQVQQRQQFRAQQRSESRMQRAQAQSQQRQDFRAQRAQAQSQQRQDVRAQRAQAQSQQRQEFRAQRAQAQSQQRQEFRAQRAQAQAQQRQESRSQQRAQFQQQRNEAAMQQRMQGRQEARAQQQQQRAQMQAQQSQSREQFRAQRQEQRAQAQQQSGGGQANGHSQRMAERQSRGGGGGRGDRRMD